MSLAASKNAIGEVTELLRLRIATRAAVNVVVGRPETAAAEAGPKLNLFLFQIEHDAHLKNYSLDEGQTPPLWMTLRYLITAFDSDKESDSVAAHRILGQGLAALHELNYLEPTVAALSANPEPLKITFDGADVELLSKIMQGSEESYRISAAFQVRPVLIMPDLAPAYALPVKSVGPPAAPGAFVMPGVGAQLGELRPERFEAGAALTLLGEGVNGNIDQVWIGPQAFAVSAAREGEVRTTLPLDTTLSPGSHPVSVSRTLPSGRLLRSNALIGTLAPTLTGIAVGALTPNAGKLFGDVTLSGRRLGGPDDAIFVAFYRDGAVALMLEASGVAAQTSVLAQVDAAHALPPGAYRLILRVNGAQAAEAFEVDWT